MLDTFRENARSWVVQVVIAAVALVFIFSFGPGSDGCRGATGGGSKWAAKVNGETVPASVFNTMLSNRYNLQRRFNPSFSAEDARSMNLREETMKEIVDRELVLQAAKKHGIWVSDEEVFDYIAELEAFQKNGKFDPKLYQKNVVYAFGLSPAKFEERVRQDLMVQRMNRLAVDLASVSDDEVKTEFVKGGEGASIEYVRFTPSQFVDQVQVTDADTEKVLKDRKADIEKRYTETKFQFLEPRAMKVQRLFEPVPADATAEQEAAAKKKVQDAAAALKAGKSFEELAKEFTNDPAAQKDGDIGWVSLGRSAFGKTFEEAVFKLKKGETSDVIRDRLGFSVARVTDERQASEKKLEDVERTIAADLAKEEKAKELAKAAAQQSLEKLKAGQSLSAQWPREEPKDGAEMPSASLAKKPQAMPTETFRPYGGMIPGIGSVPKVSQAVFALGGDKRVPEQVVEDQNAFFVFELKTRERADLAKLDEQKEQIRERLKGQKQMELRQTWVDDLRKGADIKENAELLSYDQQRAGVNQPM